MTRNRSALTSLPSAVLAGGMLVGILATPLTAEAQAYRDLQPHKSPLVLKAQGSFFVGGERVEQSQAELGGFSPGGHISINQMYVRYMVPEGGDRKTSVVLIHGMALTGKCWETTPDGRMGWDEYFVRKGHAVYVPDQIGRGRSGFNQAVFNGVRVGDTEAKALPPMWRLSDENTWPNFRFGSKEGDPFPDGQFPTEAVAEFSKQSVPDLSMGLPKPDPNYKALSDLASQLKGAVLISHSQSGRFPLEAALVDSTGIKAMVLVEPGGSPASYSDSQIATLAKLPILVVFGDRLDTPTGIPGHSWQTTFEGWKAFVERVRAAGGNARMLYLPEQGLRGSSHMLMQDKNNLRVADLILKWIDERVPPFKASSRQAPWPSR